MTIIKQKFKIGQRWDTISPFLFCAHHLDFYPKGNKNFGVEAVHLSGRDIGSDFNEHEKYRMYHGKEIPGFPVHPHRGFETITIVRKGYADHADSMGARGRYGEGDVQWMTAGSGVQHSEMFPLLHTDKENTLELFQLWLNLPKKTKMTKPDFKMLWSENIPKITDNGTEVTLISGEFNGHRYYEAPENSWANDPKNEVNIFIVRLKAGSCFKMPKTIDTNRSIYFYSNYGGILNEEKIEKGFGVIVDEKLELEIKSDYDTEFMYLEGKPIDEPVVHYGPFVMNSQEEIVQTIRDYQKTQFGGWIWDKSGMVHGAEIKRFAEYPDGRIEEPNSK